MTEAATFGARLRALRVQRGMSQADAAGPGLSASYVSRLEAGQRAPGRAVVEQLAARLGCSPEYLLATDPESRVRAEVELAHAALAQRSGDHDEAARRFAALVGHEDTEIAHRAQWGLAEALEGQGRLEAAVGIYEQLRERAERDLTSHDWISTVIALCRCYTDAGDVARAVDLGETALHRLAELGLAPGEVEVELVSTLVGCYYERGDLTRAQLLAERALSDAEKAGSGKARGAALWNASLVADARGRTADALALATRALQHYDERLDRRPVARLRVAAAFLMLRQDPPVLEDAKVLLDAAHSALRDVGTETDLAYCETELGWYHLLTGDPETAVAEAERALRRLGERPRVEAERARQLLGRALRAQGRDADALAALRTAARGLSAMRVGRQAAAAWTELAESELAAGRTDDALASFRAALAALDVVPGALPAR